jgi:hypothetical protein
MTSFTGIDVSLRSVSWPRHGAIEGPCLPWRASCAVILHRMWVDGSEFRWGAPEPVAAKA